MKVDVATRELRTRVPCHSALCYYRCQVLVWRSGISPGVRLWSLGVGLLQVSSDEEYQSFREIRL